MTFLRHAGRHVHHTVANYVEAALDVLGWTDPAATPFNAATVQVIRTPAFVGTKLDTQIQPGFVAITLGDEFMPSMEELGGPLAVQEYPIFIDIFQDSEAAAIGLATDVKDILLGRLPDTKRFLAVVNQATGLAEVGWQIELEDVERVRPETEQPHHWHVVKVTATTYFPEAVY